MRKAAEQKMQIPAVNVARRGDHGASLHLLLHSCAHVANFTLVTGRLHLDAVLFTCVTDVHREEPAVRQSDHSNNRGAGVPIQTRSKSRCRPTNLTTFKIALQAYQSNHPNNRVADLPI